MAVPRMTSTEVDQALDRLGADGQTIADALVELERHPGYEFLSSAALTGETQRRWTAAKESVAGLWSHLASYRAVLDEARQVRERRGRPGQTELTELSDLLTGPAVVLGSEDVPLEQRGLTGPATVVTRTTLADLVASMNTSYRSVADLAATAQAVLSEYAKPLDELASGLTATETLVGQLGLAESGHPVLTEISDLHGEIDTLRETVFTDPLALAGQASRAERITARLDAARDQVDALGSFRTEAAERMRRAAADIESVGAAESAARQARERARAKIAVSLPTVGDSVATLRDQLDEVRALSGDGRWPKAQESMAVLTSAIAEALRRANSARDTATALLGRRDELRGRLDAYRAKAARIGFAEDAELTAGYQRARELLWRAPCDLAAATRALAAYQRLITDKETR
ncbi:MAG TPA: hypothetical protein VF444_16855 [Pseudonocardiaceae bacterium]